MFHRIGLVLAITVLVAGGLTVSAASLPTVKIPVRAVDDRGKSLALTLDNLIIQQDKEPVTPSVFLDANSPILIAVAFDTTGDMTYIDAMRKELVNFVSVLPPGVQMMVLTANDGLKVAQKPTSDREALKTAILNYPTKGFPGFLENVVSVADYMNQYLMKAPIRVAVLFVTDSEIYKYRKPYTTSDFTTEAERDKQLLQQYFVPIFVIRLPIRNTDTFSRTYEGAMREISRSTGGETEFILSPSGVSAALAASLHRIHGTAFVGYTPPAAKPNKECKVKMEFKGQAEGEAKLEYKSSFRFGKK